MRFFLIAAFFLSAFAHAESFNNGEDVTKPLTRFDIRTKVQTGVGSQNGRTFILTLRNDTVFYFPNNWQLSLRADAPFEIFRCPRHSCSNCTNAKHMADSLLQIFAIAPAIEKWTFAIGLKEIFPTGGKQTEIGSGKFQIMPSFAFKYDMGDWSDGAYAGAILRHAWSCGGYSNASRISRTYIQPTLNINLADQWFLNFSPEMYYDWVHSQWFIPFDLMVGKMLSKKCVVSLEYENAIVDDSPSFDQELEFRIGFFF